MPPPALPPPRPGPRAAPDSQRSADAQDAPARLSVPSEARELFDVRFLSGVRAPMCVGLAAPEMRTLITLEGEGASPAPAKEGAKIA